MLRATWKSLLGRKLRLVLSGLAVVLGVMFVSGAFVLTDTLGRSFDAVFGDVYSTTDVGISARPKVTTGGVRDGGQVETPVPAEVLDRVRAVPGVAAATGQVAVDGARLIGRNGKVVTSVGPPRLGENWTGENELVELREGRGPRSDDEIVVNAALAEAAGVRVGDRVGVLTRQPRLEFTLVGTFGYSGGRSSLSGVQEIAFTEPVAQRLMIGGPGLYSSISVRAADGIAPAALRDDIATALGDGYLVKTGSQLSADAASSMQESLAFFNRILLGFAGVALFVGIFLILNTFSIVVAQRTRELALMRAVGASRRQMVGSVILEAVAVGLIASVLGLAAGVGVGALLAYLFGQVGGVALAGVGVPAAAVVSSFAVGLVITVLAAVLPALRAARIPPVAAMQDVATPDRPLTRITVAGATVTAAGATLLGLGLADRFADDTLVAVGGGVLLCFVGIALLTPLISRPVVSLLGRLFAWSVPGRLGRLNSGRNPRRTAITAAALMVGIALVTGVTVVLGSAKSSLAKLAEENIRADLMISGDVTGSRPASFDQTVLDRAAAVPGVAAVVGVWNDAAMVNGERTHVSAVNDMRAVRDVYRATTTQGGLDRLGPDQIAIEAAAATERGLTLGSPVTVQLARGGPHVYRVGAIVDGDRLPGRFVLPREASRDMAVPQPVQAFVRLDPGTPAERVRPRLEALLADSPEVSVANQAAYVKQQTSGFDTLLTMIQVLLALAILIAVLGIVNTLALSVLERTRELGLLRAIGLRRAQTMRMITVEAVVISVFGALLGVAVGSGLGVAVVHALRSDGITELVLPWTRMGQFVALAAVVGVIAAVLPAIRAARLNVLGAIAHD